MPVMTDREYRRIDLEEFRTDIEDGAQIVCGYATTFGNEYELYRFDDFVMMESVAPDAFRNCDMTDVIMQYDHTGRVFARTRNQTLNLTEDDHGLFVRADLGGTEGGRQLYQDIKGGYIDRMSFGFKVDEVGGETVTNEIRDGITIQHRVITSVKKLYDVSAVSIPANDATEISVRNLCEGALARIKAERLAEQERQRKIRQIKLQLEVLRS